MWFCVTDIFGECCIVPVYTKIGIYDYFQINLFSGSKTVLMFLIADRYQTKFLTASQWSELISQKKHTKWWGEYAKFGAYYSWESRVTRLLHGSVISFLRVGCLSLNREYLEQATVSVLLLCLVGCWLGWWCIGWYSSGRVWFDFLWYYQRLCKYNIQFWPCTQYLILPSLHLQLLGWFLSLGVHNIFHHPCSR